MFPRRKILRLFIILVIVLICWFGWGYIFGYEILTVYKDTVSPNLAKEETARITQQMQTSCRYVEGTDNSGKVTTRFIECTSEIHTNAFHVRNILKLLQENTGVIKAGFPRDFFDRSLGEY